MIEKLDTKMEFVEISILGNKKAECLDFEAGKRLNLKINELVDAVNGILAMQEQYATIYNEDIVPMLTPENKEPAENSQSSKIEQDKFAEQHNYDVYVKNRHLIGKLCKFKSGAGYSYGILTNIKRKPSQWAFESNGRAFSSCEPVKPDDDIIYKGGDNE